MKAALAILLLLIIGQTYSQTCEELDRKLLHGLPNDFPNNINCKDIKGNKQGWWIIYSKSYNKKYKPDVLDTGIYVDEYSYGKFEDNKRIGKWKYINNVHSIYEYQTESYSYDKDTIIFKSDDGREARVYYSPDSSIIKAITIICCETKDTRDTICIECNKKKRQTNNCRMTYKNKLIKEFSIDKFETEMELSYYNYKREKKIIRN